MARARKVDDLTTGIDELHLAQDPDGEFVLGHREIVAYSSCPASSESAPDAQLAPALTWRAHFIGPNPGDARITRAV